MGNVIPATQKKVTTQKKDIILLHGLFGNLSNWHSVKEKFESVHNVFIPELPLYKKKLEGSQS